MEWRLEGPQPNSFLSCFLYSSKFFKNIYEQDHIQGSIEINYLVKPHGDTVSIYLDMQMVKAGVGCVLCATVTEMPLCNSFVVQLAGGLEYCSVAIYSLIQNHI